MGQTTTQITGQKSPPPSPAAGKGQKPKTAKHEDTEKAARTTQSTGRNTSASRKREPPAPSKPAARREEERDPAKRRGPQAPPPKSRMRVYVQECEYDRGARTATSAEAQPECEYYRGARTATSAEAQLTLWQSNPRNRLITRATRAIKKLGVV